jgi:error-prone DNA polymerase
MPENEFPKLRAHPAKAPPGPVPSDSVPPNPAVLREQEGVPRCAQVMAMSNYTFLRGGSHPEEYVERAAQLGYVAAAVTDINSLAGIIRAHVAAKQHNIRLLVGARVVVGQGPTGTTGTTGTTGMVGAPNIILYPTAMDGYRGLCRLLTLGKRRAPKGECYLGVADVVSLLEINPHLVALVVPDRAHHLGTGEPMISQDMRVLARILTGGGGSQGKTRGWLAMCPAFDGNDQRWMDECVRAAKELSLGVMACQDIMYSVPGRRALQDVLTCIRHGVTVQNAGGLLHANAQRYIKSPAELHRLFARFPDALSATLELEERTRGFSLDQLRYEYPDEVVPPGEKAGEYLRSLVWAGAGDRYAHNDNTYGSTTGNERNTRYDGPRPYDCPACVPIKVVRMVEHELRLIEELCYEHYFLTVHDLVVFARSRDILCQGRGAAANSAVCYCLGVTAVDPGRVSMLFERFISKERNEPPDIDIDFAHERREEVIQYIYAKYGRERAALTAEVITYRRRSAVRDVGKALGLSLDLVDRLAKDIEWWDAGGLNAKGLKALGLNPDDPTLRLLARLVEEILGFPRHLSQHVGGFVITRTPLCELCPIENASMEGRTVIEWDKDDVDAAGMLKVDCLGLGMLTCVSKCIQMINEHKLFASGELSMATIPPDDAGVYDMVCKADTVGVFQIESRAQMSMLPRLKPRCYYDLVIEVAIVRPGPIQGDMVHPYLRRRSGREVVTYPDEHVKAVLGRTLGVPLFQEQCMALAVACAGFTPGEADQLRRAMAAWKRKGDVIYRFGEKIVRGMTERGYDPSFAARVFDQIKGFSEYGFPESHAASFALIVYVSAYLKCYFPAAFAAALINSQPMGFYAPAQIVRDAVAHGVRVLPVDVMFSEWDCTLEGGALRLGMRMVKGLREIHARAVRDVMLEARGGRACVSPEVLWKRSGVPVAALRRLAAADAFVSMGIDRRAAIWRLKKLHDVSMPLFEHQNIDQYRSITVEPEVVTLPIALPSLQVVEDYACVGLSLKAHPVSFLRDGLQRRGVSRCVQLAYPEETATHSRVAVAGLVLVRQRPGTAKGVTFLTIEDESGIANIIVHQKVYERYRRAARHAVVVIVYGRVERKDEVVHVLARRIEAMDGPLVGLMQESRNFH